MDRKHIQIFTSSESIASKVVEILKNEVGSHKIFVDLITKTPNNSINKWRSLLKLDNIRLRKETSDWSYNKDKLRIRVHSVEFVKKLMGLDVNHIEKLMAINLVKGLFDAESSVDMKGYIEFKVKMDSSGYKNIGVVKRHLDTLNIKSTKIRTRNDYSHDKTYLYIFVKDINNYLRTIGFVDKEKNYKLRRLIEIRHGDKKPDKKEILSIVKLKPVSITDLTILTGCSYFKIRRFLSLLETEGLLSSKVVGNRRCYFLP